jgi:ERCC4-type nuclease
MSNPLNEVEPEVAQIYSIESGDEHYQILYVDDQIVLLRCSESGRNNQNTHRIERRVHFEKMIESGWVNYEPDSDLDMMDFEEEDWSEVSYIGDKTSDNLHDEGFQTALDIQQASDERLLDVDGVGKGGLTNLREFAR